MMLKKEQFTIYNNTKATYYKQKDKPRLYRYN